MQTSTSGSATDPFLSRHYDGYSVTINAADLDVADVGGSFPGVLPKGFPLGKVTATGTYAKYDGSASDGTETLEGLLYTDLRVYAADSVVHGAIVLEVIVKEDDLPVAIDADGKNDVAGRILFR